MTPESDEQREKRARDLAHDRETAAILLAEQRGKETAEIHAQLNSHETRLNAINGSIERSAAAQERFADRLGALTQAFEQNIAVATARADDAKAAAEKQVSVRQFAVGLIGAVAALGMLLAATGHA